MNNVTNNAIDDLLQIVKAYVNQNAELKTALQQQKQQIQQLQTENGKLKEVNKQQANEEEKETKKDAE